MTVTLDPIIAVGLVAAVSAGDKIWTTTIEGDRCETPTGCPKFTRQMCPHGGWHPPEQFRVLDKPCPECDGDGWWWTSWDHGDAQDCPACGGGGRQVHDFHIRCQWCENNACLKCRQCWDLDGFVSVRASVTVTPADDSHWTITFRIIPAATVSSGG